MMMQRRRWRILYAALGPLARQAKVNCALCLTFEKRRTRELCNATDQRGAV